MFLKNSGKSNNYRFYLPNFLKFCDNISHKLLRPSQFLEKFMEILEWSALQRYIRPLPLLNVAGYWKNSNTEACVEKLSQILANNIDHGRRGIGLRIYVRYCSYNRAPSLAYDNVKIKLKFVGSLLKQDKITYNHGPIVKIYFVYRLSTSINSDITLENCLFGAVKITKNLKINTYSGYGIAFDSGGSFSHPIGRYDKNVIFGADLSSSVHANNRANNILVLGKEFIQGVNGRKIYAEKVYSTNFTVTNKKFCLSLHCNGDSSYLFVNNKEIANFTAKDVPYPMCLGNVSKDFSDKHKQYWTFWLCI